MEYKFKLVIDPINKKTYNQIKKKLESILYNKNIKSVSNDVRLMGDYGNSLGFNLYGLNSDDLVNEYSSSKVCIWLLNPDTSFKRAKEYYYHGAAAIINAGENSELEKIMNRSQLNELLKKEMKHEIENLIL